MRSLITLVIATWLTAVPLIAQDGPTARDDWDVFAAIMEHTVSPEITRFRTIAGVGPPSLFLVLDESVSLCGPERNRMELPCVQTRSIDSMRTPVRLPNGKQVLPGGASYDASLRTELVEAFLSRNRQRGRVAQFAGAELRLVRFAGLQDALKQHARDTVGYTAFGLPGYSADGHAMAYAFYTCGGLCGREMLFVLSRASGKWAVELVSLLSIA